MRLLLLLLILTGCATTDPQVVRVPVTVPCVKAMPPRPWLVTDAELARMNDYQLALALRQHHLAAGGYVDELEALLLGCVK